jgi:hypothetical protein
MLGEFRSEQVFADAVYFLSKKFDLGSQSPIIRHTRVSFDICTLCANVLRPDYT